MTEAPITFNFDTDEIGQLSWTPKPGMQGLLRAIASNQDELDELAPGVQAAFTKLVNHLSLTIAGSVLATSLAIAMEEEAASRPLFFDRSGRTTREPPIYMMDRSGSMGDQERDARAKTGQQSALTPDVCEALEKLRQQLAAENPIVVNDPDW